ncbi:MAG: NUDIX hydrolase [Minisyncoccia bacterium]
MNPNIPKCFYRISVKALILDETRTKFLIVEEDNGKWDLPGGGLDWGESAEEGLAREIQEEMGLKIASMNPNPCYFTTHFKKNGELYVANVLYEITLEHFNFTPSEECVGFRFVTSDEARTLTLFPNVQLLAEMFNPANHISV